MRTSMTMQTVAGDRRHLRPDRHSHRRAGCGSLLDALDSEPAVLPAPARVEFLRLASGSRLQLAVQAQHLLPEWEDGGLTTISFDARHTDSIVDVLGYAALLKEVR